MSNTPKGSLAGSARVALLLTSFEVFLWLPSFGFPFGKLAIRRATNHPAKDAEVGSSLPSHAAYLTAVATPPPRPRSISRIASCLPSGTLQ
ncbi:hypothetical protein OF83DRAFT_1180854 [Amylostereum chailletii]|nr:hypothetical protein OF83DRAFT_1180854 [Amylostereum chailletii]